MIDTSGVLDIFSDNSCKLFWPFEGNTDEVANFDFGPSGDYHVTTDLSYNPSTIMGSSVVFNGTTSVMTNDSNWGGNSMFGADSTPFGLSFFVTPAELRSQNIVRFYSSVIDRHTGLSFYMNADGTITAKYVRHSNDLHCWTIVSTTAAAIDEPLHISISWDGLAGTDNVKLYIGDSLEGVASSIYAFNGDTYLYSFGSDAVYTTLHGELNQIRCFDREITIDEVIQLGAEYSTYIERFNTSRSIVGQYVLSPSTRMHYGKEVRQAVTAGSYHVHHINIPARSKVRFYHDRLLWIRMAAADETFMPTTLIGVYGKPHRGFDRYFEYDNVEANPITLHVILVGRNTTTVTVIPILEELLTMEKKGLMLTADEIDANNESLLSGFPLVNSRVGRYDLIGSGYQAEYLRGKWIFKGYVTNGTKKGYVEFELDGEGNSGYGTSTLLRQDTLEGADLIYGSDYIVQYGHNFMTGAIQLLLYYGSFSRHSIEPLYQENRANDTGLDGQKFKSVAYSAQWIRNGIVYDS